MSDSIVEDLVQSVVAQISEAKVSSVCELIIGDLYECSEAVRRCFEPTSASRQGANRQQIALIDMLVSFGTASSSECQPQDVAYSRRAVWSAPPS